MSHLKFRTRAPNFWRRPWPASSCEVFFPQKKADNLYSMRAAEHSLNYRSMHYWEITVAAFNMAYNTVELEE
jgi:hypothetical protein